MAFICRECHDERGGCDHWLCSLGFVTSHGSCELCGRHRTCLDCHGSFAARKQTETTSERITRLFAELREQLAAPGE